MQDPARPLKRGGARNCARPAGPGLWRILAVAALLGGCGRSGRPESDPRWVNEIRVGMPLGRVVRIVEAHGGSRSPRAFDRAWQSGRPDQDPELIKKGKYVHLLLPDDTCLSAQVALATADLEEEETAPILQFEMGSKGAGFPGASQWKFESETGKHATPISVDLSLHEPKIPR